MESEGNSTIQTLGHADTSSNFTPGHYPNIFDGTPEDTSEFQQAVGMVHITCQADTSGIIRAMHSMDNSNWFADEIPYPGVTDTGQDISIGTSIYIRKDIKAKWYKTQFEHQNTDPNSECNLNIQTRYHSATTPAEPHFVKIYPTVPIDINIAQQDLSYVTVSGHVNITNDPVNINISQQDLPYLTVSGSVNVLDTVTVSLSAVTISNDPLNINITQQDLPYVTVSGQVTIPDTVTVSLSSVTISNDPLNINITQQDLPYLTVSGQVTIPSLNLDQSPIPHVWESDEVTDASLIVSTPVVIYTIDCMDFAPDPRYVRLYDKIGTITSTDRPKMTLTALADSECKRQYLPNGLQFNNGLQIKVTRGRPYNDDHLASDGDVLISITYSV